MTIRIQNSVHKSESGDFSVYYLLYDDKGLTQDSYDDTHTVDYGYFDLPYIIRNERDAHRAADAICGVILDSVYREEKEKHQPVEASPA